MPTRAHQLLLSSRASLALTFVLWIAAGVPPGAHAQTFNVLYTFQNNGQIGFYPTAGVVIDRAGNLYGTTEYGGAGTGCFLGCGTVFKLTRHGSSWTLSPVYSFLGTDDGGTPNARVVFGPDGTLYGTTMQGGGLGCMGLGCGTVFNLRPPARATGNLLHSWSETVLYRFQGGNDGSMPGNGDLVFDQAGNIYGSTTVGGGGSQCVEDCGTVYELARSNGSWTESILHVFGQTGDGDEPTSGVIFDHAGNLYGATAGGGAHGRGSVFELMPSGSGWTEQLLYSFTGGSDGEYPFYGLVFDPAGNLYGTTCCNSSGNEAGTAFELTAGTWAFNPLYSFGAPGTGQGPQGGLILDSAGNVYGTTSSGGAYGFGTVFKLTPSSGGWTYTSLHDFCPGGAPCSDGYTPIGYLTFDSEGNLYGTASNGGPYGGGVVYQITP